MYLTKYEALSQIFESQNIASRWTNTKISPQDLLNLISKPSYSLKELGLSAQGMANLLSRLWPARPKTTNKLCYYLLGMSGTKYCPHCSLVKKYEFFYKNMKERDGYNTYCKSCYYIKTVAYKRTYQAQRRAEFSFRVPKWANIDQIQAIYDKCPAGYHVDHIIPLKGKLVSGFHVENNLQYLTAEENLSKSNSFSIETSSI